MPESHALAARHYAFEGWCFVLAAARYLTVNDMPEELLEVYRVGIGPDCTDDTVLLNGGSGLVGPDGNWIEGQLYDKPGILHAEIDLSSTIAFKHDLDVTGHYSRNDIFQLSVDRRPRSSVKWIGEPTFRMESEALPQPLETAVE